MLHNSCVKTDAHLQESHETIKKEMLEEEERGHTDLCLEAVDVGPNLLRLGIVDRLDHGVPPQVVQHPLHVARIHGPPCIVQQRAQVQGLWGGNALHLGFRVLQSYNPQVPGGNLKSATRYCATDIKLLTCWCVSIPARSPFPHLNMDHEALFTQCHAGV